MRDVFALLANEPFNLKPWEIGRLTPWQVRHLLLCERSSDGRIVMDPPAGDPLPMDERYWFRRHWQLNGLRPDLIDRLWHETHGPETL